MVSIVPLLLCYFLHSVTRLWPAARRYPHPIGNYYAWGLFRRFSGCSHSESATGYLTRLFFLAGPDGEVARDFGFEIAEA